MQFNPYKNLYVCELWTLDDGRMPISLINCYGYELIIELTVDSGLGVAQLTRVAGKKST
jgi:hypothetical protein